MHNRYNFQPAWRVLALMKWIGTIGIVFLSLIGKAQSMDQKVQTYIDAHHAIAIEEQWRTGVPAAIKLAQGILESGAGEGDLALRSNNHFGIKCKSNWTGPAVYHDDDERGECFRAYESVQASYRDHSDFLKLNQRYAFLFNLDPADYQSWAWGLKKAGYATNPIYSQNLIRVIENYGLAQYTDLALHNQPGTPIWVVKNMAASQDEALPDAPPIPLAKSNAATGVHPGDKPQQASSPLLFPDGVFTHSGIKAVFVKAGTALLGLAESHKLSLGDLLRFNDMPNTAFTTQDQLIYLEKKKKKAASKSYTCMGGETPWMVSQTLGIQLKELLKLNALTETQTLSTGQVIKAG